MNGFIHVSIPRKYILLAVTKFAISLYQSNEMRVCY